MTEINKIEHLNGSNYKSWKYNAKLLLMERGLWGIASGTEKGPVIKEEDAAKDENIKLKKAWQLRSDKAYSIIALNVEKGLQVHITDTTDAHVAWTTLKNHFEVVSVAQVVRVNRRFFAAQMEENGNLFDFITKMTSLAQELRELEEDISPKKFAVTLLGALPESYSNFVTSLNTRSIDEITWDNIRGSLVEEYLKRKDQLEKRSGDSNVFNRTDDEALFTSNAATGHSHRGRGNYQQQRGGNFRGAYQSYETNEANFSNYSQRGGHRGGGSFRGGRGGQSRGRGNYQNVGRQRANFHPYSNSNPFKAHVLNVMSLDIV